jgi:hypothetical protein
VDIGKLLHQREKLFLFKNKSRIDYNTYGGEGSLPVSTLIAHTLLHKAAGLLSFAATPLSSSLLFSSHTLSLSFYYLNDAFIYWF